MCLGYGKWYKQTSKQMSHVSQANVVINNDEPLHLFTLITTICNQDFQNTWYLDSRAIQHMTLVKESLNTYQIFSHAHLVYMGDNSPLNVVGICFMAIKLFIWIH
jgi:hypothetical protein